MCHSTLFVKLCVGYRFISISLFNVNLLSLAPVYIDVFFSSILIYLE
jgi:hypothetical protein